MLDVYEVTFDRDENGTIRSHNFFNVSQQISLRAHDHMVKQMACPIGIFHRSVKVSIL
jgi:hypothetical protein